MRFKVANYSRLEIRLDTLHIYNRQFSWVDDWADYLLIFEVAQHWARSPAPAQTLDGPDLRHPVKFVQIQWVL